MSKYILLCLSLFLLITISIYTGLWYSHNTLEGATNMDTNAPSTGIVSGKNVPLIDKSTLASLTKYNSDNLDVEYHDNLQATGANGLYNTEMGTRKVYDVNGVLVDVISNAAQGNIVYYQPGSFKYSAANYVPYYEDSVYLSRSTNAIVNTPTYVTSNVGGGFCNKYKADPIQLEQQCNKINNETCAATNCCVLLGGQKCVAGGESGPTMKNNYSDYLIANKDFYYYQGKCYGNCPNTPQFPFPTLPEKLPYMPGGPGPVPPIPFGTQMPPLVTNITPPPPRTFS